MERRVGWYCRHGGRSRPGLKAGRSRRAVDCRGESRQVGHGGLLAQLRWTLRWIAVASIVLLGFQFVILPLGLALMAVGGAGASAGMLAGNYGTIFALRLILVFVGAGVLGIFVYREAQSAGHEQMLSVYVYTAFALVLVAEVMGRFLFYATAGTFGLQ
jgi:hypothetical protein